MTTEALVIINQRVLEAGIECQTARLEAVSADFLGAFEIEGEVVFEGAFDLASCSSGL